jgi:hypothetical protein
VPRWIKRLRPNREPVTPERQVTFGQRAASAALRESTEAHREIAAQATEAADLGRQLREIRERNHFAESMELLFRGGRHQ